MESENQNRSNNNWGGIIISVCVPILTLISAWSLRTQIDQGQRIVRVEMFIQSFVSEGPRYSEYDAQKERDVVNKNIEDVNKKVENIRNKVEHQENQINEQESRLRILEFKNNTSISLLCLS